MFYLCLKMYLKYMTNTKKYNKLSEHFPKRTNMPNRPNIFRKQKIILCLINNLPNNKVFIRNFNLFLTLRLDFLCIELLHYIKCHLKCKDIFNSSTMPSTVLFYRYFLFKHYFVVLKLK